MIWLHDAQFYRDVSTLAEGAGVFTRPRPISDCCCLIGRHRRAGFSFYQCFFSKTDIHASHRPSRITFACAPSMPKLSSHVVNASAEGSPSHAPNGSSSYCQRLFHPERRTQLFWSPSCRLWARSFRRPMQRQRERVTAQPHVGSTPFASAPRARRRFGHASSARCGTSTASLVRLACAGRSVRLPES